jgi:DNA-binding transcriptional regulator YiaG
MLIAFVGPCPDGCEGLHWDDNAANNTLLNLRWGTRSANLHDAVRNGKVAIGENKPQAKLTDERVRWIRANAHFSMNSLAVQLGVSCAAVKQVLDGVTWKHVT